MLKIVKKNRAIENTVLITVVRPETAGELQRKLDEQSSKQSSKHASKQSGKQSSKRQSASKSQETAALLLITTAEGLQATIDGIPKNRGKRLIILVTATVNSIELHVASSFHSLEIFRCPQEQVEGKLLVKGASTFNSVRFDEWQAKKHKHSLCLGDRVFIDVDLPTTPLWAKPLDSLPSAAATVVQENIGLMIKRLNSVRPDQPWWEMWKDPVACVMKHLLDGASFEAAAAIRVTKHGFFAAFKFATIANDVSTKTLKGVKAIRGVGTAALLVPKLGSALYFIAWDNIFRMIKVAVLRLCGHLWRPLKSILVWLAQACLGCGPLAEALLSLVG